jgi:hypothetical protein
MANPTLTYNPANNTGTMDWSTWANLAGSTGLNILYGPTASYGGTGLIIDGTAKNSPSAIAYQTLPNVNTYYSTVNGARDIATDNSNVYIMNFFYMTTFGTGPETKFAYITRIAADGNVNYIATPLTGNAFSIAVDPTNQFFYIVQAEVSTIYLSKYAKAESDVLSNAVASISLNGLNVSNQYPYLGTDSSGNIYFVYRTTSSTNFVRKYNSSLGFVTSWSIAGIPLGAHVFGSELWVRHYNQVDRYNLSGTLLSSIPMNSGYGVDGNGIRATTGNNFYITVPTGHVRLYSSTGTLLNESATPVVGGQLELTSAGNIYVAGTGESLTHVAQYKTNAPSQYSSYFNYEGNKTYYTALQVTGASPATQTFTAFTTVPSAPTSLTVSSATTGSISLSWTASAGGANYYQAYSGGSPIGSTTTGTSITISGLTSNTNYTFSVRATNGTGTSGDSNFVSTPTKATAPTGLTAGSIGANNFTLSWQAPSGTASLTYKVLKDGVQVGSSTSSTSMAISSLTANTSYNFTVIATNSWDSAPSTALNVITIPLAPTGLTAGSTVSTTGFTLSWLRPDGGSVPLTYTVYNNGVQVGSSTSSLSMAISGLTSNTTYSNFTVRATNSTGFATSTALSVTTLPIVPPDFAVGSITTSSFRLSWSTVGGAASVTYALYKDGVLFTTGVSNDGTYARIVSATSNTNYNNLTVRATNAGGYSTTSAINVVTLPTSPSSFNIAPTNTNASITWVAPGGNGTLTYSLLQDGNPYTTGVSIVGTTATVTGLSANTSYGNFSVRATNSSGSATSTASLLKTKPNAPVNLVKTADTGSSITIQWDTPPNGADSYKVKVNGVEQSVTIIPA